MTSFKWAYGVTTVPKRRDSLFPKTLKSLAAAGFERPRLFVDGPHDGRYLEFAPADLVTFRSPQIRAFGNWILGLAELFIREPWADRYALFQDDVQFPKNLRQYLEASPYPKRGYLNLYTYIGNEDVIKGKSKGTWHEGHEIQTGRVFHGKMQQKGAGALALVFDRETAMTLMHHVHTINKPSDGRRGHFKIDGCVVESLNQAGWREMVHCPSLVQHTGLVSTISALTHRQALTFPGEDFDCLTLLNP